MTNYFYNDCYDTENYTKAVKQTVKNRISQINKTIKKDYESCVFELEAVNTLTHSIDFHEALIAKAKEIGKCDIRFYYCNLVDRLQNEIGVKAIKLFNEGKEKEAIKFFLESYGY